MDQRLLTKARKKFLSVSLANELVKLNSPLKKSYALTHRCCDQLTIDHEQTLRSVFYCKKRWCNTCASITMATQINQYHTEIQKLESPQFVTLTMRNVVAAELHHTLDEMTKIFRRITDTARKRGVPLKGIRKLECKVGKNGLYHPHYHIILESPKSAEYLVAEWLLRWGNKTSPRAQDIRPINNIETALIELMKYATKITCAENAGNTEFLCTDKQMDIIFTSLHKRRLYQPFGGLRALNENAFDIDNPEVVKRAQGIYQWIGHDWYHTEYGQPLTNWKPEETEIAIYKRGGISHKKSDQQQ